MKTVRVIVAFVVFGMLTIPATSFAWLVCDPCCPKDKKSVAMEGHDKDAAISYARAGLRFFEALIALENSNTEKAREALSQFAESANALQQTLGNEEKDIKEQLSGIVRSTSSLGNTLQKRTAAQQIQLPSIAEVTGLGQKWANVQLTANRLVRARCSSK